MDNTNGHKLMEGMSDDLSERNTEMRFQPKNATSLLHPADSFVFQKLKMCKLSKTGKRSYMKLVLKSVNDLDSQGRSDGVFRLKRLRYVVVLCQLSLEKYRLSSLSGISRNRGKGW